MPDKLIKCCVGYEMKDYLHSIFILIIGSELEIR